MRFIFIIQLGDTHKLDGKQIMIEGLKRSQKSNLLLKKFKVFHSIDLELLKNGDKRMEDGSRLI